MCQELGARSQDRAVAQTLQGLSQMSGDPLAAPPQADPLMTVLQNNVTELENYAKIVRNEIEVFSGRMEGQNLPSDDVATKTEVPLGMIASTTLSIEHIKKDLQRIEAIMRVY